MKKSQLPKWKERTLLEKVFTCLGIIFALLALIFIILEMCGVNVPSRLDSLFIAIELICIGLLYYKRNKQMSIFLLVICFINLILTIINMLSRK